MFLDCPCYELIYSKEKLCCAISQKNMNSFFFSKIIFFHKNKVRHFKKSLLNSHLLSPNWQYNSFLL